MATTAQSHRARSVTSDSKLMRLRVQNMHVSTAPSRKISAELFRCSQSNPRKKLTIHVRRLCCSRALQTVQQRAPLVRTSVTRCSAAWSISSGRLQPTPLKFPRNQATEQPSQNNNTNELRDEPTPNRKRREGEIKVAGVCVLLESTVLSHP